MGFAVPRKTSLIVLLQIAIFLAVLVAAPVSCGSTSATSLRFTVTKRTSRYVIVERRSQHLIVYRGSSVVRVQGVPCFRVAKRARSYYLLARLPAPATDPIAAVRSAKAGATVVIGPGTFSGSVTVPSGVTILGSGMHASWLQGSVRFGSNSSFSDLRIGPAAAGTCGLSNAANTTSGTSFSRCQFRGGGGEARNATAVWLGHAVSDLTFSDCDFECNLATGPAGTTHTYTNVYIQPAVVSPSIDNLLFKGCHFGVSNGVTTGCPMFNVEIWSDPLAATRTHGFRDINFEDCIFESGQGELLNFSGSTLSSDNVTPNDGYSHVTNCVFKGDGAPGYTWHGGLVIEQGCGYVEVDGCTFYRGSGSAIATQRSSEQDHIAHCTITNNIFDQTNDVLDTGITRDAYNVVAVNGRYNTVTGNTITSLPTEQRPGIEIKGSDNTVTGNFVTIASNGWYTIDIVAGANNNVVTGNILNKPIRNNGTNNTL
jgi:hypothetical protein